MFGLFRKKADPSKLRNDQMRAALMQQGDDGTVAREVTHMAVAGPAGAQNETVVLEYMMMQGLSVDVAPSKTSLTATENRAVAPAAFDTRVAKLAHALEQWNWKYDGWQSATVTNDKDKDG